MGRPSKKELLNEFTLVELAEIAARFGIYEKNKKRLIVSLDKVMHDSDIRERLQVQYKRDRSLLLIEGISKTERYNETKIIAEFAKMLDFRATIKRPMNKAEVINLIRSSKYGLIHVSSHGTKGSLVFGRSIIRPEDLATVDSIYSQILTISACEVGNRKFIRKIAEAIGIPVIIAPSKLVDFLDSAVYFVVFYSIFFKSILIKKGNVYIYGSDILSRANSAFKKTDKIRKELGLTGKIKFFNFTEELLNAFKH